MAGPITVGAWAVFMILAQVPAGAAAPAASLPAGFGLPSDAEAKSVAAVRPEMPPEAPPADAGEAFRTRVRDAVSEVKAIDYDPELWAGRLGGGVEPAFNYVKDRVRFEAYPGAFRGAAGTYRDRAGNAADRALLLAQLLKSRGTVVRFAAGRLDPAAAEKLYDRLFEPAATPDGGAPADTDFTRRVRTRAARDYAMICQALGPDLPDGGRPMRADVLEEIAAGHTWVQARVGDRWVDLDPSFADAAPGKSYCGARLIVPALPESAHQRLTIRVTAERLEGGRLRSETALEFTRPVADLAERQIFLVHSAVEGQAGLGQAIAGTPGDTWKPVLWIDGEIFAGKSISFAGGAGADPPRKSIGFANALDALDAPAAPAPAAAGPRFVAEYLELVLARPGVKQPHTVRRILSDRAGAAWRMSTPDPNTLSPIERDNRGPLVAQSVHSLWVSAGRHDLADYAAVMKLLLDALDRPATGGNEPGATAAAGEFGQQVWPLAMQNLSTALWADHAFIPALNDDPAVRFYLDQPRLLLSSVTPLVKPGTPGGVLLRSETDLRHDRVRGVAREASPSSGAALARRKVWYAVLEGALEHELAAVADEGSATFSTSALLGRELVVLKPGDSPGAAWPKLARDRETAAGLAAALAAGNLAVVPKEVIDGTATGTGWWAVSPAAGGDARAVWGRDLNGSVRTFGDKGMGGRFGGGSGPAPALNVDPKTGHSLGPKGSRGGGNEYLIIVRNISLPGGRELQISFTPRLMQISIEVFKTVLKMRPPIRI